jgi:predicted nucleotidyltransferase
MIAAILQHWGADLVGLVLFGSAARNEATAESDVDVLLVLAPGIRLTRGLYREWDLLSDGFDADGKRISPQFVTLPEDVRATGGLWYEVALEGIVLWERDLSVSSLLRRIRETMARGELRRRMIHGSPYWIRIDDVPHEE